MSATYQASELAELLGVSEWAVYQSVRDGKCPFEPIRVGRRLVWPKATIDRALGIE